MQSPFNNNHQQNHFQQPPQEQPDWEGMQSHFQLTNAELAVFKSSSYCRYYLERDVTTLAYLKATERLLPWAPAFLEILQLPHPNVFNGLDRDELIDIFEKVVPPSDMDQLRALFGNMSL